MLNPQMKRKRRNIILLILAALAAYHFFAGKVNGGALLAQEKAFIRKAADAFLSSPAVVKIRKSYQHAETLVTGSSVAATAEAEADAKGAPR